MYDLAEKSLALMCVSASIVFLIVAYLLVFHPERFNTNDHCCSCVVQQQ